MSAWTCSVHRNFTNTKFYGFNVWPKVKYTNLNNNPNI